MRALAYGAKARIRNLILAYALSAGALWAEPVTIAALGDSLTQGYGLPQDAGFVPQLEAWLQDQDADVIVQNAGVSGDTTRGGLARIDWTLGGDVDALIVNLGGNDMLRGIDPAAARRNLDAILARGARDGIALMLIGLPAPGNYGADYKAEFDAIYPDLAKKYGAVYVPNFLAPLLNKDARIDPNLMQADGIHPNAKGVTAIVQAIGPAVVELLARIK